jgi:hypothetical protein
MNLTHKFRISFFMNGLRQMPWANPIDIPECFDILNARLWLKSSFPALPCSEDK